MATNQPRKPKAAGASQATVLPRKLVVGIQTADPSTGKARNSNVPDSADNFISQSIASVRNERDVYAAMRKLVTISGDMAMSVASYVRLADAPLEYRVYGADHQLSDAGSVLLRSLLTNLTFLNDYSYGYDDRNTPDDVSGINIREVLLTGGCATELVLDKMRMPFKLQPVSPSKLKWKTVDIQTGTTTAKIIPWQQAVGKNIELDIPTFFFARLDTDPTTAYPKPPFESAINATIFHAETLEDIRRAVKRSGHSRLVVTIDAAKLMKAVPVDVNGDPAKIQAWMEKVRADLVAEIEAMGPETALVLFDTTSATYLNSEIGASADYGPLMDVVDSQLATATRTPPAVLGKRLQGSQNTSSTESLLFIKHAQGVRKPVETVHSRAMTLAVRLMGFDGYVVATFPAINLRPEDELEAYRAMRQARVLEQLSLGFLTDQEASEELGTGMRDPSAPPLSGTGFYGSKPTTSSMDPATATTGGDPARDGLTSNAPKKAGGKSQ